MATRFTQDRPGPALVTPLRTRVLSIAVGHRSRSAVNRGEGWQAVRLRRVGYSSRNVCDLTRGTPITQSGRCISRHEGVQRRVVLQQITPAASQWRRSSSVSRTGREGFGNSFERRAEKLERRGRKNRGEERRGQLWGEDGRADNLFVSRDSRVENPVAKATRGSDVGDLEWMAKASPHEVLGVSEDCSEEDIKSAFRARIKEYHPDVYQGLGDADAITQRLLRAYQLLTDDVERESLKRRSFDPFEEPECIAEDLFVNEVACIGRGCPYSCVERAPDVFNFSSDTGCARVVKQGNAGEYHVQLAVGQCPRNCIHYVTPAQRLQLEDLLQSVMKGTVYSYELVTMEGLIARANFENGRYQPPKRKAKRSEEWVDWF